MPRLVVLFLVLIFAPVRAEEEGSPERPAEPEAVVPVEQKQEPEPVADRLERIEQSLRNLEQSLQNAPVGQQATKAPVEVVVTPDKAGPVADTSAPDQGGPQGFRLGHWFITVLEACFGLGIALMSVALGLILGRRQPTTRLMLKIAVNGQHRVPANDGAPRVSEDNRLNAPPVVPLFLEAEDYGLVDLKPTESPSEGRFTPPAASGLDDAVATARPTREMTPEDVSPEKTIDEILRELTGQSAALSGSDALSLLDRAGGDYSRNPVITQALMPEVSIQKSSPVRTAFDTDLADITDMDEMETQLDLARAYVEMGEPDSARALLLEVESLGTRAQQAEAARWLERCR